MVNEALDQSSGNLLAEGAAWPETIDFEALMPSLDFTVALRVVRGGCDMGQPAQADKFLQVFGDKLRPIVGDDPRRAIRISFLSSLQDDLDVELRHRGAQFPMQQETRTVQDGDLLLRAKITSVISVHRGSFFQASSSLASAHDFPIPSEARQIPDDFAKFLKPKRRNLLVPN